MNRTATGGAGGYVTNDHGSYECRLLFYHVFTFITSFSGVRHCFKHAFVYVDYNCQLTYSHYSVT